MNIKKIGLTALAASLVSVSANAGELTISGAASVGIGGYSGDRTNAGTSFTMGNQFTVSGGGELDNGLNVSLSYQLDNGTPSSGPFDDHSITISSDEIGTIKFSGHGGSSATSAMDATAAGDIWDGFDASTTTLGAAGSTIGAQGGEDNSIFYTAPSIMDGVALTASYNPQKGNGVESELGYGIAYTGVEGLTLKYATMDQNTGTAGTSGDQTAWHVSYAIGPVTATVTNNDYDMGTATNDKETDSYNISYTVSDEISISYGAETIDLGSGTIDAEYSAFVASYTAGGMTITAKMEDAENIAGGSGSHEDVEYWFLGAAFAF